MSKLTKSESSRINGAKSRGPITPEGKQRSAKNAVKHGLLAKGICLNIEKTEVFEELVADFCTRLQPADNVELRLVEQAAMAQFRYERIAASTETAMFVLKMDDQAPEVAKQYQSVDPPTRFAIAFTAIAEEGNSIQLMAPLPANDAPAARFRPETTPRAAHKVPDSKRTRRPRRIPATH